MSEYLIEKLEEKLGQLDSVIDADQPIKVASITFGYKNGELIRTLRARGALIGSGQFHMVAEQDAQLNQIIKEDSENLKQPVCAFVTFTHQEAYERCEEYLFKHDNTGARNHNYNALELFEEETKIEQAPEPSNVIWENLEVTSF